MNYLTKYYKNLCEKLGNEINFLQEQLHSSKEDELQEAKRSKKGTNRLGPEAESTASFQLQRGERGRFPRGLTKGGEHPLAKILLIASKPKKFSGEEQRFATDALQAIQQKLKDTN